MMTIVLDTETTGLDCSCDELLQVSIIDDLANTLYNSYIKPQRAETWEAAQAVNGISPEMVADAPSIEEERERISNITRAADIIIGYNGSFDLGFLRAAGIEVNPNAVVLDVMEEFAPIYGEWNDYHGCYKWQKLTTCAAYYGYEFKAHDSLEDCRATLACFVRMMIARASGVTE